MSSEPKGDPAEIEFRGTGSSRRFMCRVDRGENQECELHIQTNYTLNNFVTHMILGLPYSIQVICLDIKILFCFNLNAIFYHLSLYLFLHILGQSPFVVEGLSAGRHRLVVIPDGPVCPRSNTNTASYRFTVQS